MNKKQKEKIKSKRLALTPMLPKQYSANQRANIRAREKEILQGGK